MVRNPSLRLSVESHDVTLPAGKNYIRQAQECVSEFRAYTFRAESLALFCVACAKLRAIEIERLYPS